RDPDRDRQGRRPGPDHVSRGGGGDMAAGVEGGGEMRYVQALALGLNPAWRRLPEEQRCQDAAHFTKVVEGWPGLLTHCYSMVGLKPGTDLLVWRLASSLDELEEAASCALRTGLGRW